MAGKQSGEGIAGILKGLSELVEKLSALEQQGRTLQQDGEIRSADGRVRGIYGINVQVGLGREGLRVESFGNLRPQPGGEAVIHEIREPVCDVFEERDHLLIVAEMPGIEARDIQLEAQGDLLTIRAARQDRKYQKELHLPYAIDPSRATVSANNGVVEVKCPR